MARNLASPGSHSHSHSHKAYRVILAARIRAQSSYRASFLTDIAGTLMVGLTELAEVYVVFHNVPSLGGLTYLQALLVFALSNVGFSLADLAVGHLDTLPGYIRTGTVDAFYLRPLPLLAQLVTADVSLRRVGRLGVAATVLVVAVAGNEVAWSLATVTMLLLALVSATAICSALFVGAAALQFFLVEGSELTNAFTYGGSYASAQSAQIFPNPLKVFFTFVVPAAFVAYLPALVILGLPGGDLLPSWLGWFAPAAAAAAWAVALGLWRLGTRHYQGAGG